MFLHPLNEYIHLTVLQSFNYVLDTVSYVDVFIDKLTTASIIFIVY